MPLPSPLIQLDGVDVLLDLKLGNTGLVTGDNQRRLRPLEIHLGIAKLQRTGHTQFKTIHLQLKILPGLYSRLDRLYIMLDIRPRP